MKAKFCKMAFAIVLLLIIALFGACGNGGESGYGGEYDQEETETADTAETETGTNLPGTQNVQQDETEYFLIL